MKPQLSFQRLVCCAMSCIGLVLLSDLRIQAQDSTRANRFTDAIPTSRDDCLLSPSGKLLAVPWYEHQALYQINAERVTLLATFGSGYDLPGAFSRDESTLITLNDFEETGALVWDLSSTPPSSTPIELDCSNKSIRGVDGSDFLLVNGLVEGREVYHLLDADYRLQARIRVDHYFWQAEDFAAIAIGENNSRILIAVTGARDDSGGEFASIGRPQCIQLLAYNVDTDELQLIEREIEMNSYVRTLGFRSDGRELIAVTDYTIYRLYLDSEGNVEDISTAPNGADPTSQFGRMGVDVIDSAIIRANGSLIVQRSPGYELRWLNAEHEISTGRDGATSPLISLQTSDDGSVLVGATWTDESRVHVWTRHGNIVGEDDIGTVTNIEFSPSGSRFALEGERGIVLGTVNNGFPTIDNRIRDVWSIRFLDESRIRYLSGERHSHSIAIEIVDRDWDDPGREEVLRLASAEELGDTLSEDGMMLIPSAGYCQIWRIYDIPSRRIIPFAGSGDGDGIYTLVQGGTSERFLYQRLSVGSFDMLIVDPAAGSDRTIQLNQFEYGVARFGVEGRVSLVHHRDEMPTEWTIDYHDSLAGLTETVAILETPLEDFWIDAFVATNADGSRTTVCMSSRELIEIRRGDETTIVRHPIDYTIDAMAYSPQGWLMTVDRQGYVRIRE